MMAERMMLRSEKQWKTFDLGAITIIIALLLILFLLRSLMPISECCNTLQNEPAAAVIPSKQTTPTFTANSASTANLEEQAPGTLHELATRHEPDSLQEPGTLQEPDLLQEIAPASAPTLPAPTDPFFISISQQRNTIELSGNVGDEDQLSNIERALKNSYAKPVNNRLAYQASINPSALHYLEPLLQATQAIDDLRMTLSPSSINVFGNSTQPDTAERIRASLRDIAPGTAINISIDTIELRNGIELQQKQAERRAINCAEELKAARIEFEFGSSALSALGRKQLRDILHCIGSSAYTVIGHTDNVGNEEQNQKLSLQRANAVMTYLTSLGLQSNRLNTQGAGEAQPIADNNTQAGRAANRRIEFIER